VRNSNQAVSGSGKHQSISAPKQLSVKWPAPKRRRQKGGVKTPSPIERRQKGGAK